MHTFRVQQAQLKQPWPFTVKAFPSQLYTSASVHPVISKK